MNKIILAVVGLSVGGVLPATAADLPPPTPPRAPAMVYKAPPPVLFNWTGFYIGGNGGYSWGTANTTVTGLTPAGPPVTIGVKPAGWLGGAQVGYNWQGVGSPWLAGLETDFDGFGQSGNGTCTAPTCVPNATVHADPWFGTFRGRVGWIPAPTWLLYATGGLAYAETQFRLNQLGVVSYGFDNWRLGWTVGGGVEYAFLGNWSVKAEYLYLDYGTSNTTLAASGPLGPAPLGPIGISTRWTDNVFRAGINYRFY
jgi:outer membrane immunogenic protein